MISDNDDSDEEGDAHTPLLSRQSENANQNEFGEEGGGVAVLFLPAIVVD